MIKPTVGRVVWFTPLLSDDRRWDVKQPLAAIVSYVWGDRMVNLAVFGPEGTQSGQTSVPLLQDDDAKPEAGRFASWMPYQVGQAARTEAAEAKASGGAS